MSITTSLLSEAINILFKARSSARDNASLLARDSRKVDIFLLQRRGPGERRHGLISTSKRGEGRGLLLHSTSSSGHLSLLTGLLNLFVYFFQARFRLKQKHKISSQQFSYLAQLHLWPEEELVGIKHTQHRGQLAKKRAIWSREKRLYLLILENPTRIFD
jgi:hypothetical protein